VLTRSSSAPKRHRDGVGSSDGRAANAPSPPERTARLSVVASMSRAEAHRRERQAPDGAARDAAPPPERDATIDAHHHLWDLQAVRYPWLVGPQVSAHFGPYEKIRQDYRVEQFLRDIRNQQSVHVEAGADPADAVRETRWLQGWPTIMAFLTRSSPGPIWGPTMSRRPWRGTWASRTCGESACSPGGRANSARTIRAGA
jgi:hypothetical protein